MSSSKPPMNDESLAELVDHLHDGERGPEDSLQIDELDLPEEVRDELSRALAASHLLAQLTPAEPPRSLPNQTARRARRRLRLQRSREGRSKLDGVVTVAAIALVLGVVFTLVHQLREISKRGQVEVIKLQEADQE